MNQAFFHARNTLWVFLALFAAAPRLAVAQPWNNAGVFSMGVALEFDGMQPVQKSIDLYYHDEACAAIADEHGKLHFYVSFTRYHLQCLRDARGEVIPGSDSLWFFGSGTNSALIVRAVPDSVFYVFTHLNNKQYQNPTTGFPGIETIGLYYGKVEYRDGRLVMTKKNIQILADTLNEQVAAIQADNGRDWWIVTHELGSDRFYIVEFKADETFSVKEQRIGSVYPRCISTDYDNSIGEIAVSGDGRRIATVSTCGNIDVFDFDKTNGELGNAVYLGMDEPCRPFNYPSNTKKCYYGASFSPDASRLYASMSYYDEEDRENAYDAVYQFNLLLPANEARSQKAAVFHRLKTGGSMVTLGQHWPAPNGKIYVSRPGFQHLLVIDAPNELGEACSVHPEGLWLNGQMPSLGLPHFPAYTPPGVPYDLARAGRDTAICRGRTARLGGPPARDSLRFEWRPAHGLSCTDCPMPFATPEASTVYSVYVYDESHAAQQLPGCRCTYATVRVTVYDAPEPGPAVPSPTLFYHPPPFAVRFENFSPEGYRYLWDFGDGTPTVFARSPVHEYADTGTYAYRLWAYESLYCPPKLWTDTVRVQWADTSTSRFGPNLDKSGVRVYPNPAQDEVRIYSERMNCTLSLYDATGKQILGDVQVFAGKETKISTKHLPDGIYFVKFAYPKGAGFTVLSIMR